MPPRSRSWIAPAGSDAGLNSRARHLIAGTLPREADKSPGQRALLVASALLALLVALPIVAVMASLFQTSAGSLSHLAGTTLPGILANTAIMLCLVGLGVCLIGVGTAWLVTMCRFPGSGTLQWLLLLPLAMPAYIIGYAYTDALAFAGPFQSALRDLFGWSRGDYWFPDIHNVGGVALMLTLVLYPYVYLLTRAALLEQSTCVLEASRMLGAGHWRAFLRIGVPMARPAIVAGLALALMEALADFGTVEYFGVQTFTTAIYRTWFGMGDRVAAAQLASGLLAFVAILIALELRSRSDRQFLQGVKRPRPVSPMTLNGGQAALAILACALPVVLGFALPVLILLRLHLSQGDPFLGERFLVYIRNSVLVAGLAALVIVSAAFLLAYTLRMVKAPAAQAMVRFATLGYAIPGTVIAVGVLIPLGLFDNALDRWMRATFGLSTGLLFSGTLAALVFAYLVRFLAVAANALDTGFGKISHRYDDVARTLGTSPMGVVALVHLPLLRRAILTAFIVVFVDVLKELPATLIVRPFNFDTLAVRVYQLASDERLAQASTGALAIVVMGLVPVILLTRMIARGHGEGAARQP
jgi:iron(III) transport system permease protein